MNTLEIIHHYLQEHHPHLETHLQTHNNHDWLNNHYIIIPNQEHPIYIYNSLRPSHILISLTDYTKYSAKNHYIDLKDPNSLKELNNIIQEWAQTPDFHLTLTNT